MLALKDNYLFRCFSNAVEAVSTWMPTLNAYHSVPTFNEKVKASTSHRMRFQRKSWIVKVPVDPIKQHCVSKRYKYSLGGPVGTLTLPLYPWIRRIQTQALCSTGSTKWTHSPATRPSRWIPTNCMPNTLLHCLSPSGSSGFWRLPADACRCVTIVNSGFCLRSLW